MDMLGWVASIGGLLLLMSVASGWIRYLPLTSFSLYLLAGVLSGPWVLDLLHIDVVTRAVAMERITEVALVVSLFMTGLKLRMRLHDPVWAAALRLAMPAMVLTVAGMCVVAHGMFGLSWPLALLFGAIAAPTDPVLASMIAVDDARDHDRLRLTLSGEAGLNDGAALPFAVLAVWMMQEPVSSRGIWHWLTIDFAWSLLGGLCIGFVLGWAIGWLGVRLRTVSKDVAPSDFLALGLMAISYAAAVAMSASGFLAVFAAGLGLRQVEIYVVRHHPHPDVEGKDEGAAHPPAEMLINPNARDAQDGGDPAASMGMVVSDALSFGQTLERLIAAALVLLLGAAVATYWSPAGLWCALILFVLIRPLSVYLCTIGAGIPFSRRLLLGWLGIRGVGGLNYLAYAATHGMDPAQTRHVSGYVITLIAASIVVHGITTPLLMRWRRQESTAEG